MANYTIAAIESGKIAAQLKKELCQWEEAEQRYRDVLDLSMQMAGKFDELNELEKLIVIEAIVDANYNLAFACYVEEDYESAINRLTSEVAELVHMAKAKILLGLCYYKLGMAKRDVQTSVEAAKLLVLLEKEESQLYQEDIDSMDDNLLGEAYLCLAQNYRFGMGVEKSTEKAYLTIERGLKRIKGDLREMLEKEKARYRKTFFGGWEYR